ncbi:MAG: hypothetical protein DRP29_07855 [Thermodesulfobacteriota bacterium]|nr:MAG: hypothetical protein DRP29_07855 [Thermodesulfobacteriota bacterium]
MKKIELLYLCFLLIIIIFFGLYIRFDDTKLWKKNKKFFFYKDFPIYSEYDSYYFARLSLDIKEGKFKIGSIDNYRCFPDNSFKAVLDEDVKFYSRYAISGNLVSFIWAYLSKWFNIPLEKITWYLVPILAVLVAIPMFIYFKDLGYPYAGLIGGLIAISAPMYLARTNLMRLDHDILNLAFPFLITYTFYKFFETSERNRKYFWILLSSLFLILYQLWYGHPNLNFVLISMFLFKYFWDKRLNWIKEDIIFVILLILPQIWYIYAGPIHLYKQVKTLVFNIKSPTSADILFKDFPNIFMSISELQKLSFKEVIRNVIFNLPLGILGLIGCLIFFLFNLRNSIFILPFFGIGLLSFFSGARFVMYLAPFIGIGIGYLIHLFFNKIMPYLALFKEGEKQKMIVHFIGTLILILTIWVQRPTLGFSSYPKVPSPLVKDMHYIEKHTPNNSVIWSWWDYGYAFQLYSRRATFHDGGSQSTPKTYFIARSFTTSNPKEAWYITSFISNFGLTGIAEKLKAGISAKEVVEKVKKGEYFEKIKVPVYWIFTQDLIGKFAWIHYFGSYNFDTKKGKFGKIMTPSQCEFITNNFLNCKNIKTSIDLNNGIITTSHGLFPINYFYFKTPNKLFQKRFFERGYVVEVIKIKDNKGLVFILDSDVAKTLFNQMFILRNYDSKYFELILDDFPYMVVYKVKENIK